MIHRNTTRKSGFTMIELLIALVILTLIVTNISMVTKTGSAAYEASVFRNNLNEQLDQNLDRIALAIMASDAEGLDPLPVAPASSPQITYRASLGIIDEVVQFDDAERIAWVAGAGPAAGQVVWTEKPGEVDQRDVIWSNWVPTMFDGELPNGGDDNGNGLLDESGLSFDTNGDEVFIRMTVERVGPDGNLVPMQAIRNVTCRN